MQLRVKGEVPTAVLNAKKKREQKLVVSKMYGAKILSSC